MSQLLTVRAGVGLITLQKILKKVSYLLSFWGILVWPFPGPNPPYASRAREKFRDLEAMDFFLSDVGE